jgi:hypothetical protein
MDLALSELEALWETLPKRKRTRALRRKLADELDKAVRVVHGRASGRLGSQLSSS